MGLGAGDLIGCDTRGVDITGLLAGCWDGCWRTIACGQRMVNGLFDSKGGREAGKKSGRRKLSLKWVESELGALETLEDVQRWLRLIGRRKPPVEGSR